jgi:integrase
MNTTFFPTAPDSNGFVRIRIFLSIGNKPGFFATKIKVVGEAWSQERQVVDARQIGHKEINLKLAERKGQLAQVMKDLDYERIKPTIDIVRARYNGVINYTPIDKGNIPKQLSFYEFWDTYAADRKGIRSKGYLAKFSYIKDWLLQFDPHLDWPDVTAKFYNDYLRFLIDKKLQNNYISGHIKLLKTIGNAALRDPRTKYINIPSDFTMFDDVYIKPKPVWLDWDTDIQQLENFSPKEEDLPYLQEFLFRSYTGLRHSDLYNSSGVNFLKKGDDVYIDFMSIKTRADQNLLISEKAKQMLIRWNFNPPRLHINECNKRIKQICEDAGIQSLVEKVRYSGAERIVSVHEKWELVSSHAARRTFGRRWMENGGSLSLLCIYYGHEDEKTTAGYVGWTTKEVNVEMRKVMN